MAVDEYRALVERVGTQAEAATYLGVSRSTITKKLAGKRQITVGEVEDLRALRIYQGEE